ncbi:urea ABC transporter permease subunit UrtB [Echinimonas agarilytica]|uniref:Urea ABC transporter permease subunit UrtB n=1 Tax=Echinimonas agarilytica TaxID=1215918 RepID=A0AA41W5X5_9GAMM|nr:urea ABC transporter permease subunit UrtB [Echinimonas agarilytica]MCM2679169.1 urea ABC transporter permease subunit UrtB [Echinimonas agarilytica]
MVFRALACFRPFTVAIFTSLLSAVFLFLGNANATTDPAKNSYEAGLQQLTSKSFSNISAGVALLSKSDDPRAVTVLNMLLEGDLYRHKKSNTLVEIVGKEDKKLIVKPLFSDDSTPSETLSKRKIKKVGINNNLRTEIKVALAQINLASGDAPARMKAVNQLIGKVTPSLYKALSDQLQVEQDADVKELIAVALAVTDLNAPTSNKQLQREAIAILSDSLQPSARNALQQFLEHTPELSLKHEANKALKVIEQKASIASFAETLFFGLSLGSVLVLAAIGLAITFGVMGVINMAHGELIMLGAYTTYVVQLLMPNNIGASIFVAIPAAFLVSATVGILIERGVIRFLYGRPLETLLATFGISLILQQAVRTVFSPLNRSVATPEWMSGTIDINPLLSLTLNRLYIIVFCMIVFAVLFMVLRYTRLGIEVRAVAQNRAMARAMGVRSQWVDAMTFGLGSGIAGIAGVALSQLTNVGPNLGQAYIIDSFMVVVFGGVGNLWGTMVAGLSLGIANKIMEPWAGAVLAKILVLVFIILFIQKRPRGLFPQKGRSAEG